ncbi:MAG: hypothetical protein ACFFDY_03260 [Candidatus Thorarchaeota archaeon]
MKSLGKYITFCNKFKNHNIPRLKFQELNERYSYFYRKVYNIGQDNIYRASFIVFLSTFSVITFLSLILFDINFLIIVFYSLIISLILSYRFNLILYHKIKKDESEINAILYLIKIDFSLIQKTLNFNSDSCISFIKLIKDYKIPISGDFNNIFKKIHEGNLPENELLKVITPSKDFNRYLKDLIINNFELRDEFENHKENTLEQNFKIYLKEIQSKISIIFFIGIFFPIGLCFLLLFQIINPIVLIFLVPFFLYLLNFLNSKFVHKKSYLIGLLDKNSNIEKKKLNEFLIFLKSFAMNLKNNISPEKAFLKSYNQNKNIFQILNKSLKKHLIRLLNFECSFHDMIQFFKLELNSKRYFIILKAVDKFVSENAKDSSEKIIDIINLVYKHQRFENKLKIILKGEKFKIFFFIFLLPILIGAILGMFPFFSLMTRNINSLFPTYSFGFNNSVNIYYIIILSIAYISSISITSNSFLNIINYQKKFLIILITNMIFILTFMSSFINTLNMI